MNQLFRYALAISSMCTEKQFKLLNYPLLITSSALSFFARPELFKWSVVEQQDNAIPRLDHAFTVAEKSLGIDRLLDPEGMTSSFLLSPTLAFEVFLTNTDRAF